LADDRGLIDFGNYGLSDADVRSVAALSNFWAGISRAKARAAGVEGDGEFVEALAGLAGSLADPDWQRRWLRSWDRLTDAGIATGALFGIAFATAGDCEAALFGEAPAPRQLHLDLCLMLRRGIVAACCTAIEAKEEIRSVRSGISGEVTALATLQKWAVGHRRVGILSLTLVNRDTRSHFSASELQQQPALIVDRLQALLRPDDQIFAGRENEWLLLLPDVASKVQPSLAAAQIEHAFIDPLRLDSGRPISLAMKIGAALLPDHGRDANTAIQAARLARWAIQADRDTFSWFRPENRSDWQHYSALVEELRTAIELETLQLYLQPQVELATGRCTGAELLLRWQRRNGDWVEPPRIIEMVEQNGWRALFTDWLIRAAMRIAADLAGRGVDITLSVNLTAGDLLDAELPELLSQRLEAWDIPGSRFILELTESAMMGDRAHGLAITQRLRELGFKMSLDDFGTGYSSLSYLVSLPIHELKVDRSFVVSMFDSDENMRIVRTIVDLARDLNMVSLAEGIDDQRQVEELLRLGCEIGQGYLFSRPLPFAEFITWVDGRAK
jgi:EAL domain-containing protein (putative c-di-GMP-specific phosphodiesterase class I)